MLFELVGAHRTQFEPWSLVHYGIGGYFEGHYDRLDPEKNSVEYVNGGQRIYSALLYLSEEVEGGETFFPRLKRKIVPETGKLVVWNNLVEGRSTGTALHQALPVKRGEKWVLVSLIRENPRRAE